VVSLLSFDYTLYPWQACNCYALIQVLTIIDDERPCVQCRRQGIQDNCTDRGHGKSQYLHDAPDGAPMHGGNMSQQSNERPGDLYHENLANEPESFDKLEADQPSSEDITTAVESLPRTPTKLGKRTLGSHLDPEALNSSHQMRQILPDKKRLRFVSPDQVAETKAPRRDCEGSTNLSHFQHTGNTPLIHYDDIAQSEQQPQDPIDDHPDSFSDCLLGQSDQAGTLELPQTQDHNIYHPHKGVPPAPNSIEMIGDPYRYMQQMDSQQALFDQRYHMCKDDAVCELLLCMSYRN
jgi:hypothetical protein